MKQVAIINLLVILLLSLVASAEDANKPKKSVYWDTDRVSLTSLRKEPASTLADQAKQLTYLVSLASAQSSRVTIELYTNESDQTCFYRVSAWTDINQSWNSKPL